MGRLARTRIAARLPIGLVGTLALIAVVEGRLGRHDRDFASMWAAAWERSGRVVAEEAPRAEVLTFGDSLLMHGLAPSVVEAGTGRPTYNFAVFKGQAASSYFLLRRALEAGARPAVILLDGELLEEDPRDLLRLWPELLGLGEIAEFAADARDPSFFAAAALGELFPSVKLRHELRDGLLAALGDGFDSSRWGNLPKLRNWRENRGAHIVPPDFPVPAEVVKSLADTNYLPNFWEPHPLNSLYIEKFLDLAESESIPVVWLLPPIQPEVQSRRDLGGLSGRFESYVRDLVARHEGLVVLDGRHAGYPPQAMTDMTHLNRRGALAFSAGVAEALGPILDAQGRPVDRWIALPAYREASETLAVEDLGQSAEALRKVAAAREAMRR